MSTIDSTSGVPIVGYDANFWDQNATESQETVEIQNPYNYEDTVFQNTVEDAIEVGIYDIKTIQSPTAYEAPEEPELPANDSVPLEVGGGSVSDLVEGVAASMESANMSLIESMSISNSGVDVLGSLYAQNGIMSSPSESTWTFQYIA